MTVPDTTSVDCPNCGFEQDFVFGDYVASQDGGEYVICQMTMHGTVELARADSLAAAFEGVAESVRAARDDGAARPE